MSIVLMGSTSGSVTLAEPAIAGSTVLDLPATSGTVGLTVSQIGMKNRIINGAMVIDQRNAGASVTANSQFTLDRYAAFVSQPSKYTVQQNAGSVTPPAGFTNYLGCTSLSAYSVTSSDYFAIAQNIEGFNVADLGWGTANAKTVTLSFWVRSSLTGTFGGSVRNSADNRSYPFSYTINAANTWEYETITIAGDTSGTWVTNNGTGIKLSFSLGMGSSLSGTAGAWAASQFLSATGAQSVVGTNGATFYITGVQLELGSAATTFDFRAYGQELALCQRYYIQMNGTAANPMIGSATQPSNTSVAGYIPVPSSMRATPTASGTLNSGDSYSYSTGVTITSVVLNNNSVYIVGTTASVGAQGRATVFLVSGASTIFGLSAEL